MKLTSYEKFLEKKLIIRDMLAIDRTILSNERTFLSFFRTGLTTLVVGVSLIKFFNSFSSDLIGFLFIVIGVITFIIGLLKYRERSSLIHSLKNKNNRLNPQAESENSKEKAAIIGLATS